MLQPYITQTHFCCLLIASKQLPLRYRPSYTLNFPAMQVMTQFLAFPNKKPKACCWSLNFRFPSLVESFYELAPSHTVKLPSP